MRIIHGYDTPPMMLHWNYRAWKDYRPIGTISAMIFY